MKDFNVNLIERKKSTNISENINCSKITYKINKHMKMKSKLKLTHIHKKHKHTFNIERENQGRNIC